MKLLLTLIALGGLGLVFHWPGVVSGVAFFAALVVGLAMALQGKDAFAEALDNPDYPGPIVTGGLIGARNDRLAAGWARSEGGFWDPVFQGILKRRMEKAWEINRSQYRREEEEEGSTRPETWLLSQARRGLLHEYTKTAQDEAWAALQTLCEQRQRAMRAIASAGEEDARRFLQRQSRQYPSHLAQQLRAALQQMENDEIVLAHPLGPQRIRTVAALLASADRCYSTEDLQDAQTMLEALNAARDELLARARQMGGRNPLDAAAGQIYREYLAGWHLPGRNFRRVDGRKKEEV